MINSEKKEQCWEEIDQKEQIEEEKKNIQKEKRLDDVVRERALLCLEIPQGSREKENILTLNIKSKANPILLCPLKQENEMCDKSLLDHPNGLLSLNSIAYAVHFTQPLQKNTKAFPAPMRPRAPYTAIPTMDLHDTHTISLLSSFSPPHYLFCFFSLSQYPTH